MLHLTELLAAAAAGLIPLYVNIPVVMDDESIARAEMQEQGA